VTENYQVGDRVVVLEGAYPMRNYPPGTHGTILKIVEGSTVMPIIVRWDGGYGDNEWGMNYSEIAPVPFEDAESGWWAVDALPDDGSLDALGLESREVEEVVTTKKIYVRRKKNND
jgi:hypothetical protein